MVHGAWSKLVNWLICKLVSLGNVSGLVRGIGREKGRRGDWEECSVYNAVYTRRDNEIPKPVKNAKEKSPS
jgi:hypothetical protein